MNSSIVSRMARDPVRAGRLPLVAMLTLTVAGCASFTADGGIGPVQTRVSSEIGKDVVKITNAEEAASAHRRATAILAKPLTVDGAVQVALLNNRGLQAKYNALGISEADYVAASLPPSPSFRFERLVAGGSLDIERRLAANLLSLLTLPKRTEIAKSRFEAMRFRTMDATFRLAADTRRAYYRAVAARQAVDFLEKARLSVEASGELARKLGETGAATKLDQTRSAAFYVEISNRLAAAKLHANTEREKLTRLMGLWGGAINYKLPANLPAVPGRMPSTAQVEAQAIRNRVDLIADRLELDAMAVDLGLTQVTRYVSLLELTGVTNSGRSIKDGVKKRESPRGFELEVQIPIFDLGETSARRAQERYMQAVNRLVDKAVAVRSEVRTAYTAYRGRQDIFRQYRTRILPLRKTINEQAVLEYSGMLIDVFDLLTTTSESIEINIAAITAQRDFLLAGVDFQTAVIGGGSAGEADGEATMVGASAAD